MTLEQMDYALFETKNDFAGIYKSSNPNSTIKIKSNSKPNEVYLNITDAELEEQEKILEEDPIEIEEDLQDF